MGTPLAVRAARRDDLAEIVAIYNHYVEHSAATFEVAPVTVEKRVTWFEEHGEHGPHRLIVAVGGDDRPIGWASTGTHRPRAAYASTVEASVYCRPEVRGLGVGDALYRALLAAVGEEDVERIVAGVTLPNPASLRLHRRHGFRWVGTFTRVGRKFSRYWDVAWFERAARGSAPIPRPPAPRAHRTEPRARRTAARADLGRSPVRLPVREAAPCPPEGC